jgi:hypothetical protein
MTSLHKLILHNVSVGKARNASGRVTLDVCRRSATALPPGLRVQE